MIVDTPVFNLYIILQLIFMLDRSSGVRVTELNMPMLVDPRDLLVLSCTYDMGGEELHSVKWYKDEQEFFRYTPRQQPHIMSFPVAGIHLGQQQDMACDTRRCSVQLMHLSIQHSGGAYKCEVSTEAPRFRVGFRAGNVTVAAIGRTEPQLQGMLGMYAVGDLVQASCTAAPASPAPALTWLLNGASISTDTQRVSPPDKHGLVIASRDLRFLVERKHFHPPGHLLQLVCIATSPPDMPALTLTSLPATARLFDPQAATHQQLEWINNKATVQSTHRRLQFIMVLVSLFWRLHIYF